MSLRTPLYVCVCAIFIKKKNVEREEEETVGLRKDEEASGKSNSNVLEENEGQRQMSNRRLLRKRKNRINEG